jgi:hypothetical protein
MVVNWKVKCKRETKSATHIAMFAVLIDGKSEGKLQMPVLDGWSRKVKTIATRFCLEWCHVKCLR